ncbi:MULTISPECIES: GntR family transcriptional regulator [unclassified Streptomyces]|uniref:GntR family transcriptional regulator n=1 Tax=unclassified Streptomyces TaxID=2593676 RepID=UPI00363E1952
MVVKVLGELKNETLADRAYAALRDAIAVGELERGARITERGLAAMLSVSPTPVREALRRLEQDRLVERTGPRTLRVAEIAPSTPEEISEVEAALRGLVARFAATKATDAQLDGLDALLDEADEIAVTIDQRHGAGLSVASQVRALMAVLRSFDAALEKACGNPVLTGLLARTRVFTPQERVERTLERLDSAEFGAQDRYLQHRRLVQALRAHDSAAAEELAQHHVATALAGLRAPRD